MSAELALDLGKLKDRELRAIGEKVASRTRLSHSDAAYLFTTPDLLGIGILADFANRRKHGDVVTFAANQHINPTNVCYLRSGLRRGRARGERADEGISHRWRTRHEGGPRVLQRDVSRPEGEIPARPHQGPHRCRDRSYCPHRQDVDRGCTDRIARSWARYLAWRRRGGLWQGRANDHR